MEFNQEVIINFAPILLTFVFTIIILLTVFYKLKIRWPIRANCWFCNYNARIWRYQIDWWLCPFCLQYNGFSKDGDYKYPIPEQKYMPGSAKFYTTRNVSNVKVYQNSLCINCNNNEELKLLELRKFEKVNLIRTEKEVEEFQQIIEDKYPLCSKCKQVVNDVLYKQSLWLTRYKMMIFKQRPLKLLIRNGYKIERISRILLTIIISAIMYNNSLWPLSVLGIILQVGLFLNVSKCDKQQEMILIILWFWISVLSSFNEFHFFKNNLFNLWISSTWTSRSHFITALGLIVGVMNLKAKSFKVSKKNLKFKKLDTSPNNSELQTDSSLSPNISTSSTSTTSISFSITPSLKTFNETDAPEKIMHSPINVTNLLMNSEYPNTEIPIYSTQLLENNGLYSKQSSVPKCKLLKMDNYDSRRRIEKTYNEKEVLALNDSLHNLSTLSLNQGYPDKLVKTSNVFETKTYSTSTCTLFNKHNTVNKRSKKSILTPSKLKSMTGSWVAGGYWQAGMDPPSLSRSSSQSSGLGSAGSNLGPSRETSIYNDLDQCSIASGTVQCCCSYHKLNQISIDSNCRLNSSIIRPASPTSFNNSLPLMHLQVNNPTTHEQYAKISENVMKHLQQAPVYTGHATVITILLCSSLIVNVIVLCTVLLH